MINRLNYEEFFLMYVDGELSAAERKAVEAFVQQNPDMQEELAALKEAVLIPETGVVFDKNILFRQTGDEITTANYEEKFLLYVDEELSIEAKTEVETFVLQHPSLQDEFVLLKQAKLQPEAIQFPNKASLYREEKKERRIIYMYWQRLAIAAVLAGLAVALYSVIPANTNGSAVIAGTPGIKNNKPGSIVNTTTARGENSTASLNEITVAAKPSTTDQNITNTTKIIAVKKSNDTIVTVASPVQNAVKTTIAAIQKTSISQEASSEEPIKNNQNAVTFPADNRIDNSIAKTEIVDKAFEIPRAGNAASLKENSSKVQQVVYKELDTNNDEKTLLVGSIEINKDKLRGILRKASKIFGNNHKSADDKVAIASFAINK